MNHILNDIHSYIRFLEQCGYSVSVSFLRNQFSPVTYDLIRYDFHPHAVCSYLKQHPKTMGMCVMNKRKLECRSISKPYYGCCFAGVEEFLYPVFYDGDLLMSINVSGYRGNTSNSKKRMQAVSLICGEKFDELYNQLSDNVPSKELVFAFVKPLEYMFVELYRKCCAWKSEESTDTVYAALYVKALQFINNNYSSAVTCETIAKEMQYSPSYIRYIFKREGNTTVQAKINEIRINNAKRLLRGGVMSITDIAFSVGFSDSNYFSTVFKRYEKVSPKEYRKNYVDFHTAI